jgi:hypothetical protein
LGKEETKSINTVEESHKCDHEPEIIPREITHEEPSHPTSPSSTRLQISIKLIWDDGRVSKMDVDNHMTFLELKEKI